MLTDLHVLITLSIGQTTNAHHNCAGESFFGFHKATGGFYEELQDWQDTIAETAKTVGETPNIDIEQLTKSNKEYRLPKYLGKADCESHAQNVITTFEALKKCATENRSKYKQPDIQARLDDLLSFVNKTLWQLNAFADDTEEKKEEGKETKGKDQEYKSKFF